MLIILVHQTQNMLINGKRKERRKTEYLLHEHALLSEGIFESSKKFIQFSLKPKIFCLKKRNCLPKARASRTSLT